MNTQTTELEPGTWYRIEWKAGSSPRDVRRRGQAGTVVPGRSQRRALRRLERRRSR